MAEVLIVITLVSTVSQILFVQYRYVFCVTSVWNWSEFLNSSDRNKVTLAKDSLVAFL